MASHYHLWAEGELHVKLALVGVVCVLVVWHLKRPTTGMKYRVGLLSGRVRRVV